MTSAELTALAELHKRITLLIDGDTTSAVELPAGSSESLLQLIADFNRYLALREEARSFTLALASGKLDIIPPPRNQVAAPFKQLHAVLQHLTWQTRQVARGDYTQRVHFIGEFTAAFNSMVEALAEKERIEAELRVAQSRVRHLEGIIPICMYCKKIRDDKNGWNQLEQYISEHSEAMFSHGICPQCFEEQFPKKADKRQ